MFSIGFGRRLFGRTRPRTARCGRSPPSRSAATCGCWARRISAPTRPAQRSPGSARWCRTSRSFAEKSIASRAIVVAAGPVFNFVFAIAVFAFVYSVAGRPTDRPVVVGVIAGSAAAAAGVQPHDEITAVAGHRRRHVVDVPALVAPHAASRSRWRLVRGGHPLTLVTVTPRAAHRRRPAGRPARHRDRRRPAWFGPAVGAGGSSRRGAATAGRSPARSWCCFGASFPAAAGPPTCTPCW